MNISKAEFVISNTDYKKCPTPDRPEYAFIGRSNVGKSSLINMLTNKTKLAKTSATPGKTQLINHFMINDSWYLVDLPGYGWAKVSKREIEKWDKMIKDYFRNRENLYLVFVLIDSRHAPLKTDVEFVNWLGANGMPIAIVFTKTDKESKSKNLKNFALFKAEMQKTWEELPPFFMTSAIDKEGREEILNYIDQINKESQ